MTISEAQFDEVKRLFEELRQKDRCQRWRKIAIDQLGYVQNLTLTFAVAAIGYWFSLLRHGDFPPGSARCFMLLSFLGLASSLFCGLWCALNRLSDFRGTARRACESEDAPSKEYLRTLGRLTWALVTSQVVLFAIGAVFLAIVLFLTYGRKLA